MRSYIVPWILGLSLSTGCSSQLLATGDGASDGPSADVHVDVGSDIRAAMDLGPPTDAGSECPPGSGCTLADGGVGACCGGVCVDLLNDPQDCGVCGGICPVTMQCVVGECVFLSCAGAAPGVAAIPSPPLLSNLFATCALTDGGVGFCCGGSCLDRTAFASDSSNCGMCGLVCPTGDSCTESYCNLDGPTCGDGLLATCPSGYACWAGQGCLRSSCSGHPDDTACELPDHSLGACCGGSCVNALSDSTHCGACGHACAAGTTCLDGACYTLPSCTDPGTRDEACLLPSGSVGQCCGPLCVDRTSDTNNCGSCGVVCRTGSSCVTLENASECGTTADGGRFSAAYCTADTDCPSGARCNIEGPVGFCVRSDCTGQNDGSSCWMEPVIPSGGPVLPRSGICCGGACVDPTVNPNCGACGASCTSGVCVALLSPAVICLPDAAQGDDCASVGGCPPRETCVGGSCVDASCKGEGLLCATVLGTAGLCCVSMNGGTPICVDVAADSANCGQCNTQCPTGQTCNRGQCVAGS